jgi:hypothetical protein
MPSFDSTFWAGAISVALAVASALVGAAAFGLRVQSQNAKDQALKRFQTESAATIASANARASDADAAAADANAKAASLNERAGRLEVEAAALRETAAKAERDLLEFKERQNDRKLTDEQYLRLRGALLAGPKARAEIIFVDQGEPKRFAELLLEILIAAGWKAEIVKWNRAGMLSPGVNIESATGAAASNAAARYVAQQLVNVGTPAITGEAVEPPLPLDLVLIRVGPRPR